jgi:hypothetical protein
MDVRVPERAAVNVPDGMGQIDAREVSHGLLLALLKQHHGGSALLPIAELETSMGDANGRMWSVVIEPVDGELGGTHVRVTVVHVPRAESG